MRTQEAWFIISYDIRAPKRLQKLHRWLKRHAFVLQESVFAFAGTPKAWEQLQQGILTRIKRTEDDVKVYRLSQECKLSFYGNSPFLVDVHFAGYPPFEIMPLPQTVVNNHTKTSA